jgi:hypothetical protein
MLLRRLGFEPPRTRTPEEEARLNDALAEHLKMSRRLTLTPGEVAWLWDDKEKLREHARALVAAWRQEKEKSARPGGCASRPVEGPGKRGPSKDPYKIAIENLSRSRDLEDLAEFKRRIALFGQMVSEEAARIGNLAKS